MDSRLSLSNLAQIKIAMKKMKFPACLTISSTNQVDDDRGTYFSTQQAIPVQSLFMVNQGCIFSFLCLSSYAMNKR